ncbi:hypothetical protein [Rhodoferax sp.]|uniref:hypothetical protein n=1 Tax=Rhodoferax sp. TaxID=50421 RepID=UPI001EC0ADB3|nr:hypothetical protein [Rhodoferax sp.]MBT9508635.1 hypothetical protein [Rhodoferax sp.]
MKLQTVISTAMFAAITVLSINVQAGQTSNAKPATAAKSEQGAQASNPLDAASAPAAKKHAAQDKSKHYHPRDGK